MTGYINFGSKNRTRHSAGNKTMLLTIEQSKGKGKIIFYTFLFDFITLKQRVI